MGCRGTENYYFHDSLILTQVKDQIKLNIVYEIKFFYKELIQLQKSLQKEVGAINIFEDSPFLCG